MSTIEDRVKEVITDMAGVPTNGDDRLISDLRFDSLDQICLIMELEQEFDIEIPDQNIHDFRIVKDIVDYINGRVK